MRRPVVAGRFYPGNDKKLRESVIPTFQEEAEKFPVKGVISPHAGYIFSGEVAGATFSHIKPADKYIIIGPNHSGYGSKISITGEDSWLTPLGEIEVDEELRKELVGVSKEIKIDEDAHKMEHSVEVQLPFLQLINKDFSFVPIVSGAVGKNDCMELAKDISNVVNRRDDRIVVIASTDMTHYESHDIASNKDKMAIEKILDLNFEGLFDIVEKERITMCGYVPVTVMLGCCKSLGAENVKLIKYQTSGDTTGDKSSVVGYAGLIIW